MLTMQTLVPARSAQESSCLRRCSQEESNAQTKDQLELEQDRAEGLAAAQTKDLENVLALQVTMFLKMLISGFRVSKF